MAWKYFYKLKVNLTGDICDTVLTGNCYECTDFQNVSMCFICFSKSCVAFMQNTQK